MGNRNKGHRMHLSDGMFYTIGGAATAVIIPLCVVFFMNIIAQLP